MPHNNCDGSINANTYDKSQTGAGAGDLYTSKDQNGVTITYTHGVFHRLTQASTGSFCRPGSEVTR